MKEKKLESTSGSVCVAFLIGWLFVVVVLVKSENWRKFPFYVYERTKRRRGGAGRGAGSTEKLLRVFLHFSFHFTLESRLAHSARVTQKNVREKKKSVTHTKNRFQEESVSERKAAGSDCERNFC